ncbi:MAG: recombinase family protein [Gemmatales bacterium]
MKQPAPLEKKLLRCAIYTRKSTEEGLEQEFNSLDAQREGAEAFIKSQSHERWTCVPERYDDGGFTGGNIERPALKRLLEDIEAGRVDVVLVYKVDRLSRSLMDFARLMSLFESKGVSFVSVTQQFSTTSSMGRLTLNILLSFAQFEREIISERTRDKIAATRRKGKWSGGRPILGFDIDKSSGKLVVNKVEAEQVQEIFKLFIEKRGMVLLLEELHHRGWRNKSWVKRSGATIMGAPFNRISLGYLLRNVLYVGRVRYKAEIHPGEHPAIVEVKLWEEVQSQFARRETERHAQPSESLLMGKVFCGACRSAMTPSHTSRLQTRRYRYYVCTKAQRHGWNSCPSKSLPAGQLESYVMEQLRGLAQKVVPSELKSHEQGPAEVIAVWDKFLSADLKSNHHLFNLLQHTVERVEYHGGTREITVTYHEDRIHDLIRGSQC